jgi:prepilin-type processing-associated H-X9-DG protein
MPKIVVLPSQLYTFVDNDGNNIHVNAIALREWCIKNKPEIFWIPMKYEVAVQMVHDNSVSQKRVKELSKRKDLDPIIMVKDGTFGDNGGPNVLLVDGHHRYFLAACRKQAVIEGHVLEEAQWRPFQLHDLPKVTKEELIATPITKRNY